MPLLTHKHKSDHRPAESILFTTPLGLEELGAKFRIEAPFTACRLCGALCQTDADRLCRVYLENGRIVEHFNALARETYFVGDEEAIALLDQSTSYREEWRIAHERKFHTPREIERLDKSGFALTPQAAHKLAPFGITPLGNMHEEIVDALFTAPRAPANDAEE